MKRTLKIFALLLVLVALVCTVCACGKTGTCYICGKKDVKVTKYTASGDEFWACENCESAAKRLQELFD